MIIRFPKGTLPDDLKEEFRPLFGDAEWAITVSHRTYARGKKSFRAKREISNSPSILSPNFGVACQFAIRTRAPLNSGDPANLLFPSPISSSTTVQRQASPVPAGPTGLLATGSDPQPVLTLCAPAMDSEDTVFLLFSATVPGQPIIRCEIYLEATAMQANLDKVSPSTVLGKRVADDLLDNTVERHLKSRRLRRGLEELELIEAYEDSNMSVEEGVTHGGDHDLVAHDEIEGLDGDKGFSYGGQEDLEESE